MDGAEKDKIIIETAEKCVERARQQGLTLRIMGAAAIRIHSQRWAHIHSEFRRLSDVDFATYSKRLRDIDDAFEGMGFTTRAQGLTPGLLVNRRIYFLEVNGHMLWVDIFADALEMNHTVNFKGRLEVDYPTIPLAELFLQKMQIVMVNEKDLKDACVLLLEHEIADRDDNTINARYIADVLSRDWGFYHTVTMNLEKLKKFLSNWSNVLEEDHRRIIVEHADRLRDEIERKDKSLGWKLRAKIGTKKIWYNPVEEVERAPPSTLEFSSSASDVSGGG